MKIETRQKTVIITIYTTRCDICKKKFEDSSKARLLKNVEEHYRIRHNTTPKWESEEQ